MQELLARGAGSSPASALRLVVGTMTLAFSFFFFVSEWNALTVPDFVCLADVPAAIWVHYEYVHCARPHTATQRIRLDQPQMNGCERLAHITNYIFAQGYLPCRARSMVSWKGSCGKHIEECTKAEDVLSWGEGVCEQKPLRLLVGQCSQPRSLFYIYFTKGAADL